MIYKNNIREVTYPIVKLNRETYLIGLKNKFQIRSYVNEELIHQFEFNESGFSILKENIFFYVGSTLIKYNFNTRKESLFFKSEEDNEIWLFNGSYLFKAKHTDIRGEYIFDFISIIENRILWSDIEKLELSNLSSKFLIFTNLTQTYFYRYSFGLGKKIWNLDFSENRINGKVLLIKNILIFPTTNQDLIGIEIETGKELWRLPNCNLYHQQQPNTGYLVGLSANSFGDNFYQVIDPIRGEKLIDKKFEDFFYETTPNLACISETHYYFISNVLGDGTGKKSERVSHLGCINLKTHELEWVKKMSRNTEKISEFKKPEYHQGKFYLLDGEQSLHIYERNEIS